MKRTSALLLLAIMVASLVTGCGNIKVPGVLKKAMQGSGKTETTDVETEKKGKQGETEKIGTVVYNWDADNEIRKNQVVKINGDTFTIPSKIQDWLDAGYSFDEDWGILDEDGDYCNIAADDLKGCFVEKDGLSVMLTLYNFGDEEIPCNEGIVGDFFVDENSAGVEDAVIELPEGIQLGKSTKEEIVEAYGEPFSTDAECLPDEESLVFGSQSDAMRIVTLGISKDTGKLTSIMLVSTNNPSPNP